MGMSMSSEFKKKLQKQERWCVEGENFDIITVRIKKGDHYQYSISISFSKKNKLYRKVKREKVMFAGKLFYKINVPNYGIYRYEKKYPNTISYVFPEGFNSLSVVLVYAMKVYKLLTNVIENKESESL